jgi:hypothetical protein
MVDQIQDWMVFKVAKSLREPAWSLCWASDP